jgi:signal peptide peptidase SppA
MALAIHPKRRRHPITGCRVGSLMGRWAIEPERFVWMYHRAMATDLVALAERNRASSGGGDAVDDDDEDGYDMLDGGVARIAIHGPMTKGGTSFDDLFGGCATVKLRKAVRRAAEDNNVRALFLDVDSPGGTVNGTPELADDLLEFRRRKPVVAYVSDLCCSAAYWVAAQADRIHTNAVGFVGNIGCYSVLEDSTGAQEKYGYRLTAVASAEFKGLGADGAVTETLVAETQREVDQIHALFVAAVAAGREMDPALAAGLADGRALIGQQAVDAGLADAVCTADESLNFLIDSLAAPAAAAAS